LLLITGCAAVLLAHVFDSETLEQIFDGDLYKEYKSHEVTTLEALAQDFEWQQALWMPLALPSTEFWGWTQEADPTPLPFDPAKFPQDFVANLVPACRDGVVVYPVTAWEDEQTRDRVFYNAEGKEIGRVAAPPGYDPRWCLPDLSLLTNDDADWLALIYDPSHLMIDYELILDDDLVKWVLVQSIQSALKSQAGGGVLQMLGWEGGSVTNIQFVGIASTNGACAVTVAYPDGFTNRLDLFTCEGSNSLLAFWWDLALTTNVDLSTNWIAWTDTQAASAVHQIRFYAAANADKDSDEDGYSDGREKYLYHTDPADSNSRPFAVSGTLSYTGNLTGPLRMIAVTSSNSWIGCMATIPAPGGYTNDKVANGTSYWFKAYRDGNGNQTKEYGEPWGVYTNVSILVTNNLTGIDIVLTDHDEDEDGLPDWWEMLYFGNLDQGAGDDPDNDGVNNVDEFAGGTNPSDGNDPPNVAGVVEYSPLRPQTGTIYVVAVTSAGSWATNYSAVLTGPGAYHITSLPAGNYYLKSWRDVANNVAPDATEPQGIFSGNPVTLTGQVTGIDIPLTEDFDTDGLPDWWEVQYWGTTNAQTATNDPDSDALINSNEYAQYTDPTLADTDGDGLTDGWEVQYGFDPVLQVTNGLVGWWRLDEQRGVFIQDSSTNANHGILHGNSASFGAVGPSRWALRFAGTNDPDGEVDYIRVPDAGNLDIQNQITLAAWVYPAASNSQRQAIFEKVQAYYLQLQNGRPQFYLQGVYGSYLVSTLPLPLNAWSHDLRRHEHAGVCERPDHGGPGRERGDPEQCRRLMAGIWGIDGLRALSERPAGRRAPLCRGADEQSSLGALSGGAG
jgi:hypothetical protein